MLLLTLSVLKRSKNSCRHHLCRFRHRKEPQRRRFCSRDSSDSGHMRNLLFRSEDNLQGQRRVRIMFVWLLHLKQAYTADRTRHIYVVFLFIHKYVYTALEECGWILDSRYMGVGFTRPKVDLNRLPGEFWYFLCFVKELLNSNLLACGSYFW